MIYADVITETRDSAIQGAKPKIMIGVKFIGESEGEKYWDNRFEDMFKGRSITMEDVFRFFALNNWKRSGHNNFYFDGKK